jgi:hypothetical protein
MRKKLFPILMAIVGLGMLTSLQACVDESAASGWGPARQAHEEREFRYGPKHEVCDANGYNCMVCDADNDYCRRLSSSPGYGPYGPSRYEPYGPF